MNGGDLMLTRGTRIRINRDMLRTFSQALMNNEDHVVFESGHLENGDVTLNLRRGGRVLSELVGDDEPSQR